MPIGEWNRAVEFDRVIENVATRSCDRHPLCDRSVAKPVVRIRERQITKAIARVVRSLLPDHAYMGHSGPSHGIATNSKAVDAEPHRGPSVLMQVSRRKPRGGGGRNAPRRGRCRRWPDSEGRWISAGGRVCGCPLGST